MNLLILEEDQFISSSSARLSSRQQQHISSILKLAQGDSLSVGKLNGDMGKATITLDDQANTILTNIVLDTPPPALLPVTLILALPRPQMLKRILQTVACMGVEHLCLIQSSKVEKSFWQSPSAQPDAIRDHLILGLEQGIATQLPQVSYHRRFRPFIEDELPSLIENKTRIIAHPHTSSFSRKLSVEESVLAVGPEGGFSEKEVNMFIDNGFESITLGQRILKVEVAVPVLLSKLYL